MKTTYKILNLFFVVVLFSNLKVQAQNCIQTSQYPSGTTNVAATGTTNITSCNFAGEYSVNNFTAVGSYTINSTGGTGNYITVTDNSNNPVLSGAAPLAVTIPSVGVYRVHISLSSACGTDGSCHAVTIARIISPCIQTSQYPSGTTTVASTGTTNITTCNFGGEYSVNSFTAAGPYTFYSTGGAGNFITVTDNSNNVVTNGVGLAPLTVAIPSVGVFRVHLSTGSNCGTDGSCHTVKIVSEIPVNDNCINAITLAVPSSSAGTTINATTENPLPQTCGYSVTQPGVWYKVVGNGNQFGVDLCAATSWDSKIHVFGGTCGSWSCITDNDDNGPLCSGAAASVTWCSVPSTTYYILATGYSTPSNFTIALTQTVNVNPTVTAVAGSSSVCMNFSTSLTASGASTYSWSSGATTASISVTPTANSVYTVIGYAATGCGYDIKTVSVTSLPSPTVTVNDGAICSGSTFTIAPTGAATYSFSSGSNTVSPTTNTTYFVVGVGSNGCVSMPAVSSVTVLSLPSLTVVSTPSNNTICENETLDMSASGALTYTWNGTVNGMTISTTPTASSTYTLVGTDANGCESTSTIDFTVNPLPIISIMASDTSFCIGESATLTASGAQNYTWTSSGSTNMTEVITPTSSAMYSAVGEDSFGCINSASISITVNALPIVTVGVNSHLICIGESATLTASGANTYIWSSASGTNSGSPLVVTPTSASLLHYTVTSTDVNNCATMDTISLRVDECLGLSNLNKTSNQVRLFPNPNNGVFTIEMANGLTKGIKVMDVSGRMLISKESNEDSIEINLADFANGIYYVKVQSESTLETIKVIKE